MNYRENVTNDFIDYVYMCTDCQHVKIIQSKSLTRLTDSRHDIFFNYFKSVITKYIFLLNIIFYYI